MASNGDRATPWLALMIGALAALVALAGWMVLYDLSHKRARVALNAPVVRPLPDLPGSGPSAPPLPVPRPPS
jgi:hypothetical protein